MARTDNGKPRKGRARRKRPARARGPSRSGSGGPSTVRLLIAVGVVLALAITGYIAFDDRHWHAFDDAGDGAYDRRNFDYARSMYQKALVEARRLDDRALIAATLADLQRVAAAQGREADAARFAAEREALSR